ncbi:CaiB/BaiF CoA transferase family protein [Stappia indica]|uniref:CaiB/BaiF CoA transferase family protein n=1 Tax=Stappia indica TaxID=538381 RepID=UPI001CD40B0B|nr:CaiB/BaiF CoA-transferase family protein [Stappia indica]MCA1298166.1 CoA transferase [Stappia indica]
MTGPLSHLRVLDLSRVLAGPWSTQALADMGAEVIKIERPGAGDDTRGWGPPFLKDADGNETRESAYFLSANRGKKSVAVDLSREEGRHLVLEIAKRSDILVENYKLGGLKKYGLDYDSLKEVNPRLIYCSITGFGQTGPYAARAGYDFMIQGMGGLMSVTGEADGRPGGGPQKVGVALTDILTGLYATIGILGALAERERSGEGQHIDLALFDVQVAALANQSLNYLVSGTAPVRLGNAHPNIVPYQAFETADGHLILAVGNDGQFARFCEIAGRPELATDPRYLSNQARVANRDTLVPQIAEMLTKRTTADWIAALETAGVPCGPINTIAEVFQEPQALARGLATQMAHASGATAPGVASPLRFSRTPVNDKVAPPMLGQHTRQVLAEVLGLSETEIGAHEAEGTVAAG